MTKLKLFIDADDTMLNSSEVMTEILNHRFGRNFTTDQYLKKAFKGIVPRCDDEVQRIFNSNEFYQLVSIKPECEKVLERLRDNIEVNIVTLGEELNLEHKKGLFKKYMPEAKYIGIRSDFERWSKADVNMAGGIQIDDRLECMDSNAALKILIKNHHDLSYNQPIGGEKNLYVVNDWFEIESIIKFYINHPEFLESGENE